MKLTTVGPCATTSRKRLPPISDHWSQKNQTYPSQINSVVISRKLPQPRPLRCRLCEGSDLYARYKCCASQSIQRTILLTTWNYTYRNLEIVDTKFLSKKQIRCAEMSTQKDTQRLSSRERPPPVSDHGLRSSRLKGHLARSYFARNQSLCRPKLIPLVSVSP